MGLESRYFWWIFGRFGRHVGLQNGLKIDVIFKRPFFEKPRFSYGKSMILKDPGVEVGSQNRSKKEVNLGKHLSIDFSWILVDFGGPVGSEDGIKIV